MSNQEIADLYHKLSNIPNSIKFSLYEWSAHVANVYAILSDNPSIYMMKDGWIDEVLQDAQDFVKGL